MRSSFHQVIPTTIKLFKHTKILTIGGVVAVCNGLNMTQEKYKSSPGSKKHCHLQASCYTTLLSYKAIYKLWVQSCIFRVWLRPADTTYLQAMQDPGNPSYLLCKGFWGLGFLGWGKQMERHAASSPLAIFEHHSRDLKTASLFLQSVTTSAGTIQYWIVALQAQ